MNPQNLGEALSNSLSLSSILILTALGLAITFGVMRVINMAHGEMLMLGAYTSFVVTNPTQLPGTVERWLQARGIEVDIVHFAHEYGIYYAIPVSFLVVGFFGYLMEVCLVRFLYGRSLDTLLATWGVSLILQQSVNLWFGPNLRSMNLPTALQDHWDIGDLTIPVYRVFIVGITVLCLLSIYLWFYRTSFGLKIGAVVQNRAMASALGISTRRVDALTFAFATGLAGVAGCIVAYLYNVTYYMGVNYVVQAFMVVILGGLGQLAGSVGGGVVLGTGQGFASKFLGNEITAQVVVLFAVVAFMLIRPAGLFASKERAYD